jgi:hypothetical protein
VCNKALRITLQLKVLLQTAWVYALFATIIHIDAFWYTQPTFYRYLLYSFLL